VIVVAQRRDAFISTLSDAHGLKAHGSHAEGHASNKQLTLATSDYQTNIAPDLRAFSKPTTPAARNRCVTAGPVSSNRYGLGQMHANEPSLDWSCPKQSWKERVGARD
jgi:hypothetical protein